MRMHGKSIQPLMTTCERTIVVRANGNLVQRVDPVTRRCTGEPQQYRCSPDGVLTILPRSEWEADPIEMAVDVMVYR